MINGIAAGGMIALCCLLPPLSGWWLAARLRNESLFRFTAACLAGIATLAVAELIVFVLRVPQWVAAAMVLAACAISLRPVIAAVRQREFAWDALLTWAGASAILTAATVRFAVHGIPGAEWDWYEHWLRALVFLKQGPPTTDIGFYSMPARGPLFNAAAAMLHHFAGTAHYWAFQICATTMNALICLPFAMFLRTISGVSRRKALLIAAGVSVLVPGYFVENTFTWTKDLTGAFVLLGTHEYLVAYREGSRDGMAKSLAYLAPAFLCHYLAMMYAAMLGLHLLLVVPMRELPLRGLARAAVVWCVLVAPWFGFMMRHFGVRSTLRANSTMGSYYASRDAQGRLIPQYRVFLANLCVDLLQRPVCRPLFPPPKPWIEVRGDGASLVEAEPPSSPPTNLGGISAYLSYSGMLVLLVGILGAMRTAMVRDDARFLVWALAVGLVLNLLPVRWFDPWGSVGENLQAWLLILIAVAVRGLTKMPRAAIAVAVLAMAIEFGSVDLELLEMQTRVLPFSHHEHAMAGDPPLGAFPPEPVSEGPFHAPREYFHNYQTKIMGEAVFFRDLHPDDIAWFSWMFLAMGLLAVAAGARLSYPADCSASMK
ncbi:MAG TPA: hypothetical protein VGF49_16490 [Candidatus Solibacter sp.]